MSFGKMGLLQRQLGNNQAALGSFEKGLAIAETLAKDTLNQQAQNDLKQFRKDIASLRAKPQ